MTLRSDWGRRRRNLTVTEAKTLGEEEASIINLYLNSLKLKREENKLKYSSEQFKSNGEQPNLKDIINSAKHQMMKEKYKRILNWDSLNIIQTKGQKLAQER